jgi:hypothetical protein
MLYKHSRNGPSHAYSYSFSPTTNSLFWQHFSLLSHGSISPHPCMAGDSRKALQIQVRSSPLLMSRMTERPVHQQMKEMSRIAKDATPETHTSISGTQQVQDTIWCKVMPQHVHRKSVLQGFTSPPPP